MGTSTASKTPRSPDFRRRGEIEGAHARQDATTSLSAKDPGPRLPWIQCLRSLPDQPGRRRRGPSLATAGPPRKRPLMCLSPPHGMLGGEKNSPKCAATMLMSSAQRWWICWKKEPFFQGGFDPAHQLPRNASSMSGLSILPTGHTGTPCASTLRQQVRGVIHKSPGWPRLESTLHAGDRPSCVGPEQSALTEGDTCAG